MLIKAHRERQTDREGERERETDTETETRQERKGIRIAGRKEYAFHAASSCAACSRGVCFACALIRQGRQIEQAN